VDRPNDAPDTVRDHGVDTSDPDAVLELFGAVCDRAAAVLATNDDWSDSGRRDGQYSIDVEIDARCLELLRAADLTVLSEESGITGTTSTHASPDVVVVDPLDGSTNAALGLPWCATSLCLVRAGAPAVAMVSNLRTGSRFSAVRGRGATCDGRPIRVGEAVDVDDAVIVVNGRPPGSFRPRQYRAMGATALDIASVALPTGFDGSIDFDHDRIGVWDYLAAVLILTEAGGVAADALGRDLVTLDHQERRRPVTARSPRLLEQLLSIA
jgi:myo-inositol-1(or 4)-monophosphatase